MRGHNVCPRSRLTRSAAKSFWLLFTRVGGHPRVLVDLICRLGLYQGRAQDRLRLRFGLRLGFAFIVLKLLCLHGPQGAGRCPRILWLFMQQVSTASATATPPHSHSLRTRRSSCASLAQNTNVDGLDSTITLSRQQQFHLMRWGRGRTPPPLPVTLLLLLLHLVHNKFCKLSSPLQAVYSLNKLDDVTIHVLSSGVTNLGEIN